MLPNASDLKFFVEVSETLNLSRAAERLGVSQPALSQGMKRLEHAFGQDLLLRNKSGVVLTRAGERLKNEAKLLLDQWEKIVSEGQKDYHTLKGKYSIGAHPSVALYTLPSLLPSLMGKFPELELKLEHNLSRKITEEVISFKLDIGIVINPVQHPDLVIVNLCSDVVGFFKSKKLTADLNDVLIYDPDLIQSQDLLGKLNKKKHKFNRHLTSSSLELIKSLTLNGTGVGLLPSRVAMNNSKGLELIEDLPKFNDQLCLIYRHDAAKGSALKLLISEIKKLES